MAAKKKEFKQCHHCGRDIAGSENPDGFKVRRPGGGSFYQLSCPCGIMTRLCHTKEEAQAIWHSRPGKPVKKTKLEVKHTPPRGAQKGDMKLGPHGEKPF